MRCCDELKVDSYAREAAVLTAFAESDFKSDASQIGLEDQNLSYGVYQQKLRWWPTTNQGTEAQCKAFLAAFAKIKQTGFLVQDCWQVQRWAPSDKFDPTSPETLNYSITHGGQWAAQQIIKRGTIHA